MELQQKDDFVIPPKSAVAFKIEKGQVARITDIEGQQVGDFAAFNLNDFTEKFSASRTRLELNKLRITRGDPLLSNNFNTTFDIEVDTCGVHDIVSPPCDRFVFVKRYGLEGRRGCRENLTAAGF